uniref:RNase H type-1 domain-containing protein n=1 Tax=viral metagenome TaxID=1070528 RepID=A0A6C0JH15_9ZZZZ
MTMLMKSGITNLTAILGKKKPKIYPQNYYLLQFDGCSKGNPGMAAAGAVLYKNDIEIWSGSKFLGYNETNNYAEYMGLIMGLSKAIEFDISELIVEGDSMLIIKQMNGENQVRSSNIIELHKLAMQLKLKFSNIIFTHIYRENNKKADDLCNEAIDKIVKFDNIV